jgi:hypothetical protein
VAAFNREMAAGQIVGLAVGEHQRDLHPGGLLAAERLAANPERHLVDLQAASRQTGAGLLAGRLQADIGPGAWCGNGAVMGGRNGVALRPRHQVEA